MVIYVQGIVFGMILLTIQLLYQTVVSAKQRHYEYRLLYIRHSEPWSVITGAFERLLRQNYDLYPFSLLCKSCYAVLVTSSKDQKSTCTSEICPTSYYWKSYMYIYIYTSLFLGVILLTDNSNPAIVKYIYILKLWLQIAYLNSTVCRFSVYTEQQSSC